MARKLMVVGISLAIAAGVLTVAGFDPPAARSFCRLVACPVPPGVSHLRSTEVAGLGSSETIFTYHADEGAFAVVAERPNMERLDRLFGTSETAALGMTHYRHMLQHMGLTEENARESLDGRVLHEPLKTEFVFRHRSNGSVWHLVLE